MATVQAPYRVPGDSLFADILRFVQPKSPQEMIQGASLPAITPPVREGFRATMRYMPAWDQLRHWPATGVYRLVGSGPQARGEILLSSKSPETISEELYHALIDKLVPTLARFSREGGRRAGDAEARLLIHELLAKMGVATKRSSQAETVLREMALYGTNPARRAVMERVSGTVPNIGPQSAGAPMDVLSRLLDEASTLPQKVRGQIMNLPWVRGR